ncbi:MAG: hypothetical protein R6U37_04685 [Dehalococcoidia bacterium]
MRSKLLERSVGPDGEKEYETCVHHWIIESPTGPVSKGTCKKCGAEKEFSNYFPYSKWEGEKEISESRKSLLEEWGI